jgi:hypothetical protein
MGERGGKDFSQGKRCHGKTWEKMRYKNRLTVSGKKRDKGRDTNKEKKDK